MGLPQLEQNLGGLNLYSTLTPHSEQNLIIVYYKFKNNFLNFIF